MDTRTEPSRCPYCGQVMDTHSSVGEDIRPKPGDITICINCAEILQLDDKFALQKINAEILKDIQGDLELYRRIQAIQTAIKAAQQGGK